MLANAVLEVCQPEQWCSDAISPVPVCSGSVRQSRTKPWGGGGRAPAGGLLYG